MASLTVDVIDGNNLTVEVTPVATTEITLNRGLVGPAGPAGPNTIGGYPIAITTPQNYDALMFVSNEWVNIPQVEITDGGNF
jgi:hypothetical protein